MSTADMGCRFRPMTAADLPLARLRLEMPWLGRCPFADVQGCGPCGLALHHVDALPPGSRACAGVAGDAATDILSG